ncbi:STAS domain-containing protein [Streptomyces sp. NRRL S-350]|uniref:STAS domain-containing protein n=1 Tax=Streptomyces sp. NRRL S-350 TaxID=1463902 RepID=UPI00068A41F7|nr:STAS domain-containing protein [Streptomyces sp. NRRL S-350]
MPEGEADPLHVAVDDVVLDQDGPVRVVTVSGELDHDTADGLRTALARPLEGGVRRLVVDLADLRFCDSTGLNILLRAHLDTEAAGLRLDLAGPSATLLRLLAITGADTVLRIHPDLASALAAPEGPAGPLGPAAPTEPE